MFDAVAEARGDDRRRNRRKRRRCSRSRPAAAILERLRQVPVVERHARLDAASQQLVDQPIVEVEAALVDRALGLGQDAGPRDREAVGVETGSA